MKKKNRNRIMLLIVVGVLVLSMVLALVIPVSHAGEVETVTEYTGETADLNLLTMDGTLERVQLAMVQYRTEKFEEMSVFAYGRIYDMTHFQDPYYDGSWTYSFTTEEKIPAIGTSVILRGTMKEGVVTDAKIEVTD